MFQKFKKSDLVTDCLTNLKTFYVDIFENKTPV